MPRASPRAATMEFRAMELQGAGEPAPRRGSSSTGLLCGLQAPALPALARTFLLYLFLHLTKDSEVMKTLKVTAGGSNARGTEKTA